MKPQLVTNQAGVHNQDLVSSVERVKRGGSWKDQSIIWITPSADSIPAKVVWSWLHLIFPPNNKVVRMLALGMEVGDAYSSTVNSILDHPELSNWKYILTLEHDNIPPQDGVLQLVKQMEDHPEYACIGGLYWTKGPEGVAQIWGDPKAPDLNYRPQPPVAGKLVECNGTGMGFNLWRISMFKNKKFPRPFFRTKCSATEGVGTQDLAFWAEAKKLGYRCAIDCSVLVGHHDQTTDTTW
jgi:hypothetical protein